jgi:hypothetical protein
MKHGAMVVAAVLAALGIGFVVGNGRAAAGAKADTRADVAAIQKLQRRTWRPRCRRIRAP